MAIEFVDKWPHLGHIISATRDDKVDIMSKRNTLCQHINNVLCFFASRDPITKLKLMKAYCNSFYGSVLWDLANASIRDVCIVWRKGLTLIWDLPHNTHCIICFHYSAIRYRLSTSSAIVVQHLLRTFLIAITMQSAMLHGMVSISVGYCRRLVAMLSSVACSVTKHCIY